MKSEARITEGAKHPGESKVAKQATRRNQRNAKPEKPYDLEERTARFGEEVIKFAKRVPVTPVTKPLIGQLVKAGTSVGSNYCEADDAGSRKEFKYRISVCKREARESKHWLRMIAAAVPALTEEARDLWREAQELHLIFASIYRGTKVAK